MSTNQVFNKKKKYESPSFDILLIKAEGSIAIGSSTITPISSNNDNNIEVFNWTEEDKGMYDIDL